MGALFAIHGLDIYDSNSNIPLAGAPLCWRGGRGESDDNNNLA